MFRTRYIKSLIVAAAAFAASCTADPIDTGSVESLDGAEPASLTIDLSVADLGIDVSTRAEADSGTDTEYTLGEKLDPDHPERMDEAAAYINGSKMECLVVLLIHRPSNRIVGVRELPGCSYTTVEEEPTNGFVDAEGRVDPNLTSGSRARITFNYERPMHYKNGQSVEQLLRGNYQIFAIANYKHLIPTSQPETPANQPSAGYETLNLHKALNKILSDFHANPDVGLGDFNSAYEYFYNIRFLMNCTLREIEGSEEYEVVPMRGADGNPLLPYIRPAVMQTLSATKNVSLKAGQNKISLELLRISSRTRVEVKNTSATPLKIHSLEFSSNYTQSTNYLFRRERNEDNYVELSEKYYGVGGTTGDGGVTNYVPFTGAPLVSFDGIAENGTTTAGAIVPFANNMDLDHDGVKECVGVPAGEKGCIFDALMYESYDVGNPFTYTIDVSYPEVTDYRTTDFDKIDAEAPYTAVANKCEYALTFPSLFLYLTGFNNVNALKGKIEQYPSSDGYYFFIQSGSGYYLYVNANGELRARYGVVDIGSEDVASYLWEVKIYRSGIDGNGPFVCDLKNVKSGKYIPLVTAGSDLGNMSNVTVKHTPMVPSRNVVSFATMYLIDNTPIYLNVNENDGTLNGSLTSSYSTSQFYLYPMKSTLAYKGTPRTKKTVTLATFSDETAFVEQVREIQRNDFMRILVEVSYNPDSSEFLFEASSWNEKEGAVEFN